jgi:hypothetical protein
MKKTNRIIPGLALLALAFTFNHQLSTAHAQGTAFTYQGRLSAGGNPASGVYDLSFALYDAASGGTQHGLTVSATAVGVTNGLFTVTLDFGNQFSGSALWLDISVRTNGAVNYTELSPRQPLTPTPYAITAENLDGTLPASQLSGTVPLAQIPSAVVTNNESAVTLGSLTLNGNLNLAGAIYANSTVSAAAFTGSGAGLTSLNAVNLIGSVPDARLSANVALLNASQTFSGQNTFSGATSLGSTLRMNRNAIYLREGSDQYHGLSWSGSSPFAGISPDGPVLFGGTGGGLGFTGGTTNLALAWNNAGGGNAFTDPAGINAGSLMPGLTFGPASGEGISSKRTSGTGQFALDFYTASNLRMRINNSGNVGIGTTSPTAALEVQGGPIKATGGLIIETRTSDPSSPATGQIWLRTDL